MSEDDISMNEEYAEDRKERHGCVTAFVILGVLGTAWNLIQLLTGKQLEGLEMAAAERRRAELYEEAAMYDSLVDVMQSQDIITMGIFSAALVIGGLIFVWRFKKNGIMLF